MWYWPCVLSLWPYTSLGMIRRFHIWVKPRNCGCLVTWFCYQLIAKPGNKTVAVPWPDSYLYHCVVTETNWLVGKVWHPVWSQSISYHQLKHCVADILTARWNTKSLFEEDDRNRQDHQKGTIHDDPVILIHPHYRRTLGSHVTNDISIVIPMRLKFRKLTNPNLCFKFKWCQNAMRCWNTVSPCAWMWKAFKILNVYLMIILKHIKLITHKTHLIKTRWIGSYLVSRWLTRTHCDTI